MHLKSLRELVLMLNLYNERNLTICRLQSLAGLKSRWLTYNLRDRLVEEGFIYENGGLHREKGFLKLYRVNHKRLDDFFVTEFPTYHIYRRTRDGPISVFPGKKPNDEKMKKWTNSAH